VDSGENENGYDFSATGSSAFLSRLVLDVEAGTRAGFGLLLGAGLAGITCGFCAGEGALPDQDPLMARKG